MLGGSVITAIGLALVAPRQQGDLTGLVIPLVIAGIGHALLAPGLRVAAVEAAPKRDAGLASGTFSTSRYFGGIVSAIVFAAIARGGAVEVAPVFLGVAAVSLVGAVLGAAAARPAQPLAEDANRGGRRSGLGRIVPSAAHGHYQVEPSRRWNGPRHAAAIA